MFGMKTRGPTVLQRLDAIEGAVADIQANQSQLAEAFRTRAGKDAELSGRLNAVEHDTAALVGSVSSLRDVMGEEPAPNASAPAPEPAPRFAPVDYDTTGVGQIVDETAGIGGATTPFAGDNQADDPAPAEAGETDEQQPVAAE
jgi:hypothetical protein